MGNNFDGDVVEMGCLPRYVLNQIVNDAKRGCLKKRVLLEPERKIIVYQGGKKEFAESSDFRQHEFQWWIYIKRPGEQGDVAICRACAMRFFTKFGRDKHFEDFNCRRLITQTLKRTSKLGKCLVCGNTAIRSKYGALLCGDTCQQSWLSGEARSQKWLAELAIEGKSEKI